MPVLYANNAASRLAASITNVATSFSVTAGHGAKFPAISGADYFYVTLMDSAGNLEVVEVTARATDTFTVVRAQDGTTARAYAVNDIVELRITKAMLDDFKTDTLAGTYTGTIALANGGTGKTTAPAAMANLMGFTTTATTGGTTILDNTSSYYQIFTGSTTQTVRLPVTSTLATGWTFHICNNSTGNVFLQSSGVNAVITVIPGTTVMCTCIGTTFTTAADWEAGYTDFSTVTGTGAVVLGSSPTLATPTLTTPAITFSTAATVTAGTNAQGQGALTSDYNVVTTAAANPSGVTLPGAPVGRRVIVVNKSANPINIYPAGNDIIDALAVNLPIPLPVGGVMMFNASSNSQWYSTYNLYTTSGGYATTVTAAGSTALTSTSGYKQYFTGTTTQTVTLPDVATLSLGRSYEIVNNSTGVLTVNSFGANPISTIPAGMSAVVTCIAITGTTATSWHFEYTSYDAITGTGAAVFSVSPTITGNDTTIEGLVVGLGGGAVAGNTAYGETALNINTTGGFNTAIGYAALQLNIVGEYNTAVGSSALADSTGDGNTAVGALALQSVTTGANNTAVGTGALPNLLTGNQNVGIGDGAMTNLNAGNSNTAVGKSALGVGECSVSVAVGFAALQSNTADGLVGVGSLALLSNTSGFGNVAVGYSALTANTTGSENVSVGNDSSISNTTGARNTALGYATLTAITTAGDSTAIGAYALNAATGGNNTAVGSAALTSTVGGLYNTAVGDHALAGNISGTTNTAVGYNAGSAITGSNNVVIGAYTGAAAPISATGSNWIVLSDGSGNVRQAFDPSGNSQMFSGAAVVYCPAPTTITAAATLTNADIQAQIINTTGATAFTLTLPLGTTLETLIPWSSVNLGYDFYVINSVPANITMAANTGVTIVGRTIVGTNISGQFRIRRTAANTFIVYRIS